MARDEQALRDFAERTAAMLAGAGFPRMPARVLMTLMISDSEWLTAGDLAERLGASAAAISGAVRYLQNLAMIRRVSVPGSRRDGYELPDDLWYTSSLQPNHPLYDTIILLCNGGLAAVDDSDDPAWLRLTDMRDFFEFTKRRLPQLLEEWKAIRGARDASA
jgi:DNA-binding transcriptional regulator GbsR (MarR family)